MNSILQRFPRLYEWIAQRVLFPWLGMGAREQVSVVEQVLYPSGRRTAHG